MTLRHRQRIGRRYVQWLAAVLLGVSLVILVVGGITVTRLVVFGLAVCNVGIVFVILRRGRRGAG